MRLWIVLIILTFGGIERDTMTYTFVADKNVDANGTYLLERYNGSVDFEDVLKAFPNGFCKNYNEVVKGYHPHELRFYCVETGDALTVYERFGKISVGGRNPRLVGSLMDHILDTVALHFCHEKDLVTVQPDEIIDFLK